MWEIEDGNRQEFFPGYKVLEPPEVSESDVHTASFSSRTKTGINELLNLQMLRAESASLAHHSHCNTSFCAATDRGLFCFFKSNF